MEIELNGLQQKGHLGVGSVFTCGHRTGTDGLILGREMLPRQERKKLEVVWGDVKLESGSSSGGVRCPRDWCITALSTDLKKALLGHSESPGDERREHCTV